MVKGAMNLWVISQCRCEGICNTVSAWVLPFSYTHWGEWHSVYNGRIWLPLPVSSIQHCQLNTKLYYLHVAMPEVSKRIGNFIIQILVYQEWPKGEIHTGSHWNTARNSFIPMPGWKCCAISLDCSICAAKSTISGAPLLVDISSYARLLHSVLVAAKGTLMWWNGCGYHGLYSTKMSQ